MPREEALCINTVFIPGIRYKPDSAVLAQDTCTKNRIFRCQNEALCINTVFIPGIRYKPDSAVLAQDTCTKIGYFGAKTKLCALEKALCTGKSSVPQKTGKLSQNSASPNSGVLAQGVCTRDGFFDAKTKLCARQKALCLCTALEKAPCTQPFRKKGQGLPKNKEKLQTVPFLPVQGRLIVLLFIVFLHYHAAVMAPKP